MARVPLPLALIAACLVGGDAAAIGIGAVDGSIALGQVLELTVPVQLADGEVLEADCVGAELRVGESRVPADRLAIGVQPGSRAGQVVVRIRAGVAATEPVVALTLAAGCPARIERRYLLFADPPALAAPVTTAATVVDAPPVIAAAVDPRDAPVAARPHEAPVAKAARSPDRPSRSQRPAPRPQPERVDPRPAGADSRLLAADAAAVSAARQDSPTDAALARHRSDVRADGAAPDAPRARAVDGGIEDRAGWMAWGLATLAAISALAGAMAWRRFGASAPAGSPSPPARADESATSPAAQAQVDAAPLVEVAPVVESPTATSRSAPAAWAPAPVAAPTPSLDLTADEQLDLEQQVDFLIVLGQDDAAIDLLHAQVRSSGGLLPMPYLKLLEIHRRLGDRDAYERTAQRFGQRFNATAPAWAADPAAQRRLEDDPELVAALQRRWPRPLETIAWLETLLQRRSDDAGVLDLAAFDDALLLYRVARDLHGRESAAPASVDVLLPFDDAGPAAVATAATRPGQAPEPAAGTADLRFELDFGRVDDVAGSRREPEALSVR